MEWEFLSVVKALKCLHMTLICFPTSLLDFAFYIRLKKKKNKTKDTQNKTKQKTYRRIQQISCYQQGSTVKGA